MTTSAVSRDHKNFINGEWVEARQGRTFENRNPANSGELIGIFPSSTHEDVNAAVEAAKAAYAKWRLVPAPRRAEILYRAAETLVKRKEDLARDMTREMGKPLSETRGDVQEAIDMTYYMAGEGRRLFGQTVPSELPNKFAMSVRDPLGVVGMITPWNFPDGDPIVENHARAGLRKYGGHQAGRGHAAFDLQSGANPYRIGLARRGRECRERHGT